MDPRTISRRRFLGVATGMGAGVLLVGCGTSGPRGGGGGGGGGGGRGATYWYLNGEPGESIRTHSVDRFNEANADTPIEATTFQNDAYKTKIKTAIGAGQAPTIIWGWVAAA